ncbi:MAG: hypothetical protein O3A00_11565, partial [Planctomycetota bacterium]|nr:hypothetical protein [Planctomycetota bacterium]
SSVRNCVKSEIPLDVEIERAREMVSGLMPEIRQCLHVIAEQKVEIDRLETKIARKQKDVGRQEEAILALREDLKSGGTTFKYVNHTYTAKEVARELELRFARFKTARESLRRDDQILVARRQALDANQKELDKMLQKKQELEVQIVQLEARFDTLKANEISASISIDNSELARATTLIEELNRQLDIRENVLAAEGRIAGDIPVELSIEDKADVLDEIDSYFEGSAAEKRESKVEVDSGDSI